MIIKDILIGLAIGDAFGAGVEFQDRNWIRKNVDFTTFVNVRNQIIVAKDKKEIFTKNYTPWDYTDDTEMTIGVLKALMSKDTFTEELLIKKWKEEYEKGIREKGFGRNGHGSMSWYYSGDKTIEEVRDFQRTRSNPGNAPAMRSLPLGLITENKINEYAAINANATHPNINAVISSQCIARATEFICIKKEDPKKVIKYCIDTIPLNKEYKTYLKDIDHLGKYEDFTDKDFVRLCGSQPIEKPYFLSGIYGMPSDSKYTAGCVLYILKESINAIDALQKSVYLGGDVDSVASITTGIMSGKTGLLSIPEFMIESVEGIEYVTEIAKDFNTYLNQIGIKTDQKTLI
ncbi:ADP-ribosylglycohydrolase family protein [Aquimarina muelleri]|uniref:ADP-ribosylglycohydrolase family protein n=1 Tax=Aquimarina muelleri TaxID=279356 RepID=UPI003F68870C